MPLKPHVEAILNAMASAGGPSMHELSPADGRNVYRTMHADLAKPELAEVKDIDANGIALRLYRASSGQDQQPCIIFYHGGGWVIGDLDTHDAPCRLLAEETGFTVIAVDYRLAPEHPFPAPVDDAYSALVWIEANAIELGIDPNKLAVAGDSAGGNLATVVCIKARDEAGPSIKHQLLIYPVTDGSMNTESYQSNGEGYLLSKATMEWFFSQYATENQLKDPLVSPLHTNSLQNLPPATVFTAEFDPLRDEGEAYATALEDNGVRTVLQRFDGQVHGFFTMTDLMPEALEAVKLGAAQLKRDLV